MPRPNIIALRNGSIIGHVDAYGAVDSHFIPETERLEDHAHSRYWPGKKNGLWRWNFSNGLTAFVPERAPDAEGCEAVRNHLTKKYGIKFWDNGYHDLDDFIARLEAARAKRSNERATMEARRRK